MRSSFLSCSINYHIESNYKYYFVKPQEIISMNPINQQKIFNKLLAKPENIKCADCNSKSPTWASIDFGVFICLNCSGAHRALGPSVTRVRSTKLDSWNIEWTELLVLGNQKCNHYWERNLNSFKKPTNNSSLEEIKKYVVEKYIKRRFVPQGQSDPVTQLKLQRAKTEQFQQTPLKEIFKAPKQQKVATKQIDFEKISIITNPDFDLLSFNDLDNSNTSKVNPVGSNNSSTKKSQHHIPNKEEINLLSFEQLAPKKNHSLDFHTVSSSHQFYADIHSHPNKNFYQINQNPYQPHANNNNLFNTNNFSQFSTNSGYNYNNHNYYPPHPQHHANNFIHQGNTQGFIYGNTNHIKQVKQNSNQQQPITMNINMNMYANNLNINIQSQPGKKKDLLSSFDQFRF